MTVSVPPDWVIGDGSIQRMRSTTMRLGLHTLASDFARLEPLSERHREGLRQAMSDDETSWSVLRRCRLGEHFADEWQSVTSLHARGQMNAFAVKVYERLTGATAFIDPDAKEATVEIGATWFRPGERRGTLNPAVKRLMLAHAFDHRARRVQFRVDVENARSRAAVLKLGATHEGIARQDKVTWTGRIRDTAVYSILPHEWPAVRDGLDDRLNTLRRLPQKPCDLTAIGP